MSKVKKALGALLGGVTGGAIILIAGAFGAEIDPGMAATIAGFCALVGTYLAPPNETAGG